MPPLVRENDSPAERSFQVGVQKVALEPECPTESLSRHSRLPTLQGVLMQYAYAFGLRRTKCPRIKVVPRDERPLPEVR